MAPKLHWYCLTFASGNRQISHYIGRVQQKVTLRDIEQAGINSGAGLEACLLACSYLGKMTEQEFNNVESND